MVMLLNIFSVIFLVYASFVLVICSPFQVITVV